MSSILLRYYNRRINPRPNESEQYIQTVTNRMYNTISENREIQKRDLYDLLRYAVSHVPYYKEIYNKKALHLSPNTVFEDIKSFPILTKSIIRSNFTALHSDESFDWSFNNASGGSTGNPIEIVQDGGYKQKQLDLTECFNAFSGYHVGDKAALVWGAEKDIISPSRIGTIRRALVSKYVKRTIVLNSFSMTIHDMQRFVRQINRFKPDYMLAYAQSANELAQYIEANKLSVRGLKGVITSAGTLYYDFRNTIERVFKCKVFNRYGSRETGLMAMECEKHEGLHINSFAQYIELLDNSGNRIKDVCDDMGRVIVTNLNNHIMPLIRYDIGDMAQWGAQSCSCGRGLPLLKTVNGRTVNVFKKRDGTLIDGEYFTHLFYHINSIKGFQVIQKNYEDIDVVIAMHNDTHNEYNETMLNEISEKIRHVMGSTCHINFTKVDDIKPTKSGKYVYTISNI